MGTSIAVTSIVTAQVAQPGPGPDPGLLSRCIESALTGLAPASCRVYRARIAAWRNWHGTTGTALILDREHVNKYLRYLELQGSSAQVRNQTLAALKKLALEASELGWMGARQAVEIQKLKSKRIAGVRSGRWLTLDQAAALMAAPDRTTLQGRRDACVLALLLGCGLRRAEAVGLETAQIEHRVDGTMLLRNIAGKGGRIRSIAVPGWAQKYIQEWKKEIENGQRTVVSTSTA